jgi:hypothetical protein
MSRWSGSWDGRTPTILIDGKEYYGQMTDHDTLELYEKVSGTRIVGSEYTKIVIPYLAVLKASNASD